MNSIDNAMKIRIYDLSKDTVTNEIAAELIDPNGRILSIGNDMTRPEVTKHLESHPEISIFGPIDQNSVTDHQRAYAMFRFFNDHYIFPNHRIHLKPKFTALVYHGFMSEEDKTQYSKILLDIGYKNALVLSSDEIMDGHSDTKEAIRALSLKYKNIRTVFEIDD